MPSTAPATRAGLACSGFGPSTLPLARPRIRCPLPPMPPSRSSSRWAPIRWCGRSSAAAFFRSVSRRKRRCAMATRSGTALILPAPRCSILHPATACSSQENHPPKDNPQAERTEMMNWSFQLYSARNFLPWTDVLEMLSKLGYAEVEGFGGVYDDPKAFGAELDKNGLAMPTGHFSID